MHFKVQSWLAQSLYKQIGHLQMEMCEFIKLAGETIAMLRIIQDKLLNLRVLKKVPLWVAILKELSYFYL